MYNVRPVSSIRKYEKKYQSLKKADFRANSVIARVKSATVKDRNDAKPERTLESNTKERWQNPKEDLDIQKSQDDHQNQPPNNLQSKRIALRLKKRNNWSVRHSNDKRAISNQTLIDTYTRASPENLKASGSSTMTQQQKLINQYNKLSIKLKQGT